MVNPKAKFVFLWMPCEPKDSYINPAHNLQAGREKRKKKSYWIFHHTPSSQKPHSAPALRHKKALQQNEYIYIYVYFPHTEIVTSSKGRSCNYIIIIMENINFMMEALKRRKQKKSTLDMAKVSSFITDKLEQKWEKSSLSCWWKIFQGFVMSFVDLDFIFLFRFCKFIASN